jgi:hypothetical protein
MPATLDYARRSHSRSARAIGICASALLAYPLLVACSLYGEWLLARAVLGHAPRPSLDDPKDIAGSRWLHILTALLLMGMVLAAPSGLAANVLHLVMNRPGAMRSLVRLVLLVVLWVGIFALLHWDPGRVMYWWLD